MSAVVVNPFDTLLNRLLSAHAALNVTYLPNKSSTVPPSDSDKELARAFVLLFHAELETYFEEVALQLIREAKSQTAQNLVSPMVFSVLAFAGEWQTTVSCKNGGEFLSSSGKARKLASMIHELLVQLEQIIKSNDGAGERYLAKMFVPLGITNYGIDNTWMTSLSQFCSLRGKFAHISRELDLGSIKQINSPQTIFDSSNAILVGAPNPPPNTISSIFTFNDWAKKIASTATDKTISIF